MVSEENLTDNILLLTLTLKYTVQVDNIEIQHAI